jgi:O-antigen/teichoic acid export membrane protein
MPEDLGIFGIAAVSLAAMETFSQVGLQSAIIQKKGNGRSYLDVAWTFFLVRGIVLFFLAYLLAPCIASFFNSPEALSVIRILSLLAFITGVANPGIILLQKEMQFNQQVRYEMAGNLIEFALTISLTVILGSVWGLVYGAVGGGIIKVIVSYLVHPYRPQFSLKIGEVCELLSFGKWIGATGAMVFVITQGDDIFVGKVLGIAALGMYQVAYRIGNLHASEITRTISYVTLPAYCKLQDDISRLSQGFVRVLQMTLLLVNPLVISILMLAEPITLVLLGEKWKAIVLPLKILCIAAVFRSVSGSMGPVFLALKKAHVTTEGQTLRLGILVMSIYPLTLNFGMIGTCISVLLCNMSSFIFFSLMLYKNLKPQLSFPVREFALPGCSVLAMAGVILCIQMQFSLNSSVGIVITLITALGVYSLCVLTIDTLLKSGLRDILRGGHWSSQGPRTLEIR